VVLQLTYQLNDGDAACTTLLPYMILPVEEDTTQQGNTSGCVRAPCTFRAVFYQAGMLPQAVAVRTSAAVHRPLQP